MLLLADENFPYSSFKYLKEQGYDIKHIGESDMGIKDEEVIQLSIDEGRVITTFDSDFGELIFKHSLRNSEAKFIENFAEHGFQSVSELIAKVIELLKKENRR